MNAQSTINYHFSLNLLDLACPKPLLFTKKKLTELEKGQVLALWVNQEKNLEDIKFFCQASGHLILDILPLHELWLTLAHQNQNIDLSADDLDPEQPAWAIYIQKNI